MKRAETTYEYDGAPESAFARDVQTPPEIHRTGDDLTITYPVDGVSIAFDQLSDTAHGVDGMVTIRSVGGDLLHWSWLNLASLQTRNALVAKLAKTLDIEWRAKIEHACYEAATGFRQHEVTEVLIPRRRSAETAFWINGFIPKTNVILYGPGGEAKSLLALAAGASLATGTSIIGNLQVAAPAPVMYLDFEDDKDEHEDRYAKILAGAGLDAPKTLYYRKVKRPLVREAARLRRDAAERHVGLVILDSLSWAATPGLRWDEQAQEVFGALREFAPATALVLGHVNSAAAAASSDPANPFGSVLVRNAPGLAGSAMRRNA